MSTLALAACASGGDGPLTTAAVAPAAALQAATSKPEPTTAKVALLLPLSGAGPAAPVAKGLKQAAELALLERGGTAIELIVKDDKGTPEGAESAAAEAVGEGAELILGPLFAHAVAAVAPVARQARVLVVAFSNDRQVAGNGTYLLSFQAQQEIDRIVSFAAVQGRQRLAALVPDDAYGRLAESALGAAAANAGAEVVAVERYRLQANGMVEPVRRLADEIERAAAEGQPVDALFIPADAETLASLGPVIAYAQIDTRKLKLLGAGGWDAPGVGRDPMLVGGWYPAPDPRGWREFAEKFQRTFGAAPPRIATLAYDAVSIAIGLADGPRGARFTHQALTRATGFSGLDGAVRLATDGTAERGLAVHEVQRLGASVIDPAPAGFNQLEASSGAPRVN
jgi:ABC-type branched-subunit amino acid transport system substrate-binding protein